jgi:hypothetical protein
MRVVRTAGAYVRYVDALLRRPFSVRLVKDSGAGSVVFARSAWPAMDDPAMSWWWKRSADQASSELLALVAATGDRDLMGRARTLNEHVHAMELLDGEFVDTFFDLRRAVVGDRIARAVPAYLQARHLFETRLEELLAKATCPKDALENAQSTPAREVPQDPVAAVVATPGPSAPAPVPGLQVELTSLRPRSTSTPPPSDGGPFEDLNRAER